MHLSISMANWLVDRFASRLNAGRLAIYASLPPVDGQSPLVELAFQATAFHPAAGTIAEAYPLAQGMVQATGEARSALLIAADGEVLADVLVKLVDSPSAEIGDVLVTRTDFQRGGRCEISRLTLTIPLQC